MNPYMAICPMKTQYSLRIQVSCPPYMYSQQSIFYEIIYLGVRSYSVHELIRRRQIDSA